MKNIKLIIAFSITILISSCNDFGDNYLTVPSESALDPSVVFSSVDLAKSAVDGIMIPFAETNSYRGRFLPWYGFNTDAEWYNTSESTTDDKPDLCNYDAKPNNSQMNLTNNC